MPFIHTKSSYIILLTVENFISSSTDNIIQELHIVTNMYKAGGLNMNVYHGDNELKINALRYNSRPESLKICSQGQHILIIKIFIQTIKQGASFTTNSVP